MAASSTWPVCRRRFIFALRLLDAVCFLLVPLPARTNLGLFFTFFLIFLRFVPMIAITEVKAVLPQADPHYYNGNGHGKKAGVKAEGGQS